MGAIQGQPTGVPPYEDSAVVSGVRIGKNSGLLCCPKKVCQEKRVVSSCKVCTQVPHMLDDCNAYWKVATEHSATENKNCSLQACQNVKRSIDADDQFWTRGYTYY